MIHMNIKFLLEDIVDEFVFVTPVEIMSVKQN